MLDVCKGFVDVEEVYAGLSIVSRNCFVISPRSIPSACASAVVLPPQKMPGQKPSVPVKTGTQIPDVQTIAVNPHREMVISSLGIGDLMGVS